MADYPLSRARRDDVREAHRARILAKAEAEATLYGQSIRCRESTIYGNHEPAPNPGCTNTGTNCLCPCHDRAEESDHA